MFVEKTERSQSGYIKMEVAVEMLVWCGFWCRPACDDAENASFAFGVGAFGVWSVLRHVADPAY